MPQSKLPNERSANTWDASLYDTHHAFVWQQAGDLVDWLAPQPGERILDLGCGTGQLTAEIAGRGAHVVGLDQSEAMIAQAREHFPALDFRVGDARSLAHVAEFDAVFSNAALHWIPEAAAVAHGIARALRPGGRLVAEFGGAGNVRQLVAAADAALEQLGLTKVGDPWYFPSVATYATVMESAGLEVHQAILFDRPTPLVGDDGCRNWFRMFGGPFLQGVPDDQQAEFLDAAERAARPHLFAAGQWTADYRRLRVLAVRPAT